MALDVRLARPEDVDSLVLLAAMLSNESPVYSKHAFSKDKTHDFILDMMEHGAIFVADDGEVIGFFVGAIVDQLLSHDTYALESGVFVRPDKRGGTAFVRMLHAFEAWARDQGVREIHIGVSTQVHQESTVRMYERMGFKVDSVGMMKEV